MIITPGSVSMLTAGAQCGSLDVNAVREDGKQFFSGLLQCEDDANLRKRLDIDEYQPVVQIFSRTWHGSYGRFPNIKFVVTDGTDKMSMRVSYRCSEFAKRFFSKTGPFHSGRLNVGKKIKLIDYTCDLHHEKGGISCPTIYVENLRAEPKKTVAKKT
jgi:hypothetical protein